MIYKVYYSKKVEKQISKIPKEDQVKIYYRMNEVANGSLVADIKKMENLENTFRLRVGDYRVIYEKDNEILFIQVIKVGHRKNIYQ